MLNKKCIENLFIFIIILIRYLWLYKFIDRRIALLVLLTTIILILIYLIKMKIDKNEFKNIVIISIILIFGTVISKKPDYIYMFLLSLVFLNKKEECFMKKYFIISIIFFINTIILSVSGVISSPNYLRYINGSVSVRYSLGFGNPNAVFLFWLPIVFSLYYITKNKFKFILITIIPSLILFKYTDCRTGFLTLILFYIYIIIDSKKIFIITKKILPYFFTITTVFIITISTIYGGEKNSFVNQVFNMRPKCVNFYINNGDIINFLGNKEVSRYYLDNLSIYLLVELGIIMYLFFNYVFYKSSKIIKDKKILIILFFHLVYAIAEANTQITSTGFIIVILFKYIIKGKYELKNSEEILCKKD